MVSYKPWVFKDKLQTNWPWIVVYWGSTRDQAPRTKRFERWEDAIKFANRKAFQLI